MKIAQFIAIALIVLACVFIGYGLYDYTKSKQLASEQAIELQEQTAETDSAYYSQPPTISEILQFRRDILEGEYYDSVFLHMPTVPLIAILLQYGTELPNSDIGRIYEEDQQTWDNVQLGSQIYEKYIQPSIKEPDPLPEPLAPDSTSHNNNLTKQL